MDCARDLSKMSAKTLSRVEKNDPALMSLKLSASRGASVPYENGQFWPGSRRELSRLGRAIADNRHLQFISVNVARGAAGEIARNGAFLEGLGRNASIKKLAFECCNFDEGAVCEILNDMVASMSNIAGIMLIECSLGNDTADALASYIARCKDLQRISLTYCNADDNTCAQFLAGIRGKHPRLGLLNLSSNRIGRAGCEALAALLQDPDCGLTYIDLGGNRIDGDCQEILANSLKNNDKLRSLQLCDNAEVTEWGWRAFAAVLCDTASVNDTYRSNHTLTELGRRDLPEDLAALLGQNRRGRDYCGGGRRRVATEKILRHHPRLDVAPFLEWDLKVLPVAVSWFDQARNRRNVDEAGIEARKLAAIYQFARVLPLMFVPPPPKGGGEKTEQ